MNVAALFSRVLDSNGAAYLPYEFSGDWTEAEKEVIKAVIDQHVPERVDAMFNNWRFSKQGDDLFLGWRATWEMGSIGGDSADKLAADIRAYYHR